MQGGEESMPYHCADLHGIEPHRAREVEDLSLLLGDRRPMLDDRPAVAPICCVLICIETSLGVYIIEISLAC